jgi:hypothetical protein
MSVAVVKGVLKGNLSMIFVYTSGEIALAPPARYPFVSDELPEATCLFALMSAMSVAVENELPNGKRSIILVRLPLCGEPPDEYAYVVEDCGD